MIYHCFLLAMIYVDKEKTKYARTHCGNTLPRILYVKTSFKHILSYMAELGTAKVGPRPKSDILGQISQVKKSMLAFSKRFGILYIILIIMTLCWQTFRFGTNHLP